MRSWGAERGVTAASGPSCSEQRPGPGAAGRRRDCGVPRRGGGARRPGRDPRRRRTDGPARRLLPRAGVALHGRWPDVLQSHGAGSSR
jgi:hypothetical protein